MRCRHMYSGLFIVCRPPDARKHTADVLYIQVLRCKNQTFDRAILRFCCNERDENFSAANRMFSRY